MKKQATADEPRKQSDQPEGGSPTVGGVTPANPGLDPTTGLPFEKLPKGATAAQIKAEKGEPGHPTTGGLAPKTAEVPADKVATVATTSQVIHNADKALKRSKPVAKVAAKKAPAKKVVAKKAAKKR